jgi:hypothetical protein
VVVSCALSHASARPKPDAKNGNQAQFPIRERGRRLVVVPTCFTGQGNARKATRGHWPAPARPAPGDRIDDASCV